ncbi:hypothetical protein AGMMS49944_10090 [Spirochaetia bacterium]|nr:hypothetical protein AGMMS49944_10090 [Spirochaetia bacterium]
MNGWDVLSNIINGFPPVAITLLLVAVIVAAIIFIVGFTKHGVDFIKHGFRENLLSELMAKLATKEDMSSLKGDMSSLKIELDTIKDNHFGHLKNYLGVLNGVLLDKKIIDNETKARMDNELRGM